jgi:hypothetical protein
VRSASQVAQRPSAPRDTVQAKHHGIAGPKLRLSLSLAALAFALTLPACSTASHAAQPTNDAAYDVPIVLVGDSTILYPPDVSLIDAPPDTPADATVDATVDNGDSTDETDAADAIDAPEVLEVFDECGTPLTTDNLPVCNAVIQSWADEGHLHYPIGTDIHYCTNPPNSGPHYPIWAAFITWPTPLPQPYLVHDMEHGAVELRYNCPTGCDEIVAQLQAIADAQPDDPICDVEAGVHHRIIIIPDPDLDVPIAATAWSWTYKATCLDVPSITMFLQAHYGQGAEDLCVEGFSP